jgi:hypothetical protein
VKFGDIKIKFGDIKIKGESQDDQF